MLVVAATLILDPRHDGPIWRVIRLDAILGIAITGIVFGTILAGLVHHEGISAWINTGFHYFAPWWTVAGWLLFGPRPRITGRLIVWAFVWPVAWIGYTFIRGAATGWYPFPFLNVTEVGYLSAVRNIVFVFILAALIAAVVAWGDRKFPPWPFHVGKRERSAQSVYQQVRSLIVRKLNLQQTPTAPRQGAGQRSGR